MRATRISNAFRPPYSWGMVSENSPAARRSTSLGEIETPILLTCTLCVWKAADAMAEWMLALPGMERVRSINPLVAETNDGTLNDIRSRPVTAEAVRRALESASGGPVTEGSVGAGAGTIAFGWKGGIGTSSRLLPSSLGGYTVGVLVQTNFGGVLPGARRAGGNHTGQICVRREREFRARRRVVRDCDCDGRAAFRPESQTCGGSRDAGTGAHRIERVERFRRLRDRVLYGEGSAARVGCEAAHHDRAGERRGVCGCLKALWRRWEEAVYNSLFMATTVTGNGRTIEALPLDRVRQNSRGARDYPQKTLMMKTRHHWIVRVTHWVNAVALTLMVGSGLRIFNASPAFAPRAALSAAIRLRARPSRRP